MEKTLKISHKKKKVVGIILTYNTAHLLEKTYRKLPKGVLDQIIISDDASKDEIEKIAKKLRIPFFTHPHTGYGGNIKFGVQKAMKLGADYMVEIHGDGQYDYAKITEAVKKIQSGNGYDFVIGSRMTNLKDSLIVDRMPIIRFFGIIILTIIADIVLQLKLTEVHSGFRVYSKKFFETIGFENTANGHIYSFENLAQAKYNNLPLTEIAVNSDWVNEHTSMNIKNSILYCLDMFRVMSDYLMEKAGFKRDLFNYSRNRKSN